MLSYRRLQAVSTRRWVAYLHTGSYHPKVRVLPFAQTPSQAKELLRIHVLDHAPRLFRALPSMLPEPELDKLVMVYYPTWVISANATLQLNMSGEKGMFSTSSSITCDFGTFPGSSYMPLATTDFLPNFQTDLVEWNEEFKHQNFSDGTRQDIVCLPYNISPFVPDSLSNVRLDNSLTLTDSPQINFYAALPVLVPVYIRHLRYEYDGRTLDTTLWLDGSHPPSTDWFARPKFWSMIYVDGEDPPLDYFGYPNISYRDIDNPNPFKTVSKAARLGSSIVKQLLPSYLNVQVLDAESFERTIWRTRFNPEIISNHAATGFFDMEDIRIRPYMEEEVTPIRLYTEALKELTLVGNMQTMKDDIQKETGISLNEPFDVQSILDSIRDSTSQRKPRWWIEYENRREQPK